jgi:putative CRISPR-associated protein (TIGR02619 family)
LSGGHSDTSESSNLAVTLGIFMSRVIVTTVGTSLLTNREDGRPWAGWKRGSPLPSSAIVNQWLASADPVKISAETNTLHNLSISNYDWLELLHSQTDEGLFCAQCLASYYAAICRKVALQPIDSLNYHHESFSQHGLKSLVAKVFDILDKEVPNRPGSPEVIFAATGGFKAEIAFLNLIGALLNIEVYYIHEQFRELVRLPRLPLTWDTDYVTQNQDFFEWIEEASEPRSAIEAENWLKGRPQLRSLVEESGNHVYLNVAGSLLYKAAKSLQNNKPKAHWPPADSNPPQQKNGVSKVEHHRPNGWELAVNWLCSIDCVTRVIYDTNAYGGSPVKVTDNGDITVRYTDGNQHLPLLVSTTANTPDQSELVCEYIRRRFKA